ncbi:MAG: type I restriction-modification system endonuclease [Myxococcales bacterium]|nr:type I restriction-modification system endonuclease [Myxococcales bacterium]
MPSPASPNFAFLAYHDARLVVLGTQAERLFADDPVACLGKLRLFGEILAQRAAARLGLLDAPTDTQIDLLRRLAERGALAATPRQLFHDLRRAGNAAVHEGVGDHHEALHQLKMARELGVWFQRAFGNDRRFDPGPFTPPADPAQDDAALAAELGKLREALAASHVALATVRAAVEEEARKRLTAEERAAKEAEERAHWEALAQESEAKRARDVAAVEAAHATELAAVQARAAAAPVAVVEAAVEQAAEAASAMDLDEAATRRLIDAGLAAAGWEVDSETLTHGRGARPVKGKNRAIAEWRVGTGHDRADYALFVGREIVAVVEAKRKRKDVSQALMQAERYSRGFRPSDDAGDVCAGGPWGKDGLGVPFLFATNGRPYLRQIAEKSGIWFRDARRDENHGRALEGFYTPEGLVALLKQDIGAANQKLAAEPTDYLGLREYQVRAIKAVEAALARSDAAKKPADHMHTVLVAMATGTGKTRTAIGLVYRLLKTKRFRRVLFLVDRTALGEQAANAFKDARLENLQTFADIFDMKELKDIAPDPETKLQIATVQGMVKRILFPGDPGETPPVDQYDCVVVDECHRGYGLDREMSDSELRFRDLDDYVSKFRRVLDHFDAVKIGLTATPALHTVQIFGEPTFRYSYPEAVIDGYLIDHEPPIRIVTKLAKDGIHWAAGSEVKTFDHRTQTLDLVHLADEVDVEIDSFNKKVLTENFNRVVCAELAKHIDPSLRGKTLVFAATDNHADLLVRLLKEAFDAAYGSIEDSAVLKITGSADQPLQLIRRFKNELLPNVAVTVDLLTTGIDVPEITNIVFLRRVRSRILYEQMVGRATRLCPDIDKTVFRIFDAVDLYTALEEYTDMTPVVPAPTVTFADLVRELTTLKDEAARQTVLEQLIAKLQRKRQALKGAALDQFKGIADMGPGELAKQLKSQTPAEAAKWFAARQFVVTWLDMPTGVGEPVLISEHADALVATEHGYGAGTKPDDYLAGFAAYLRDHMNRIPALMVVTQRPRELTRKQLKEVELALASAGYTDTSLRTAWRDKTNADIAASIVGFIRQAALGDPLLDYAARVDRALATILARQKWTTPQRDWLGRFGKQIKLEKVVDREALDQGAFAAQGGFKRFDKTFDGKLEELLGDLRDAMWAAG